MSSPPPPKKQCTGLATPPFGERLNALIAEADEWTARVKADEDVCAVVTVWTGDNGHSKHTVTGPFSSFYTAERTLDGQTQSIYDPETGKCCVDRAYRKQARRIAKRAGLGKPMFTHHSYVCEVVGDQLDVLLLYGIVQVPYSKLTEVCSLDGCDPLKPVVLACPGICDAVWNTSGDGGNDSDK